MNHDPPYSLDLKPSDFYLFPAWTDHLSGHCFTCDEDIKCATSMWLMHWGYAFYTSRMNKYHTLANLILFIPHIICTINHTGTYTPFHLRNPDDGASVLKHVGVI